jgi:hypothetical protein
MDATLLPGFAPMLAATALAAGYVLSGRLSSPARSMARTVILFLALRLLLLGNPVAWQAYARLLSPYEVGWRQYDAIRLKAQQYAPLPQGVRYLAVGSSQTGVIYDSISRERADLAALSVAAMGPADLVLYSAYIARYRPSTVLLYLSDFDIARPPSPEALVIAPPQGQRLLRLALRLREAPEPRIYRGALIEMAIGDVFPEYRYRFIFRGLAGRAMRKVAARLGRGSLLAAEKPTKEQMTAAARAAMVPGSTELNLKFLNDFLSEALRSGISVVIVEGHYNPVVMTPEILETRLRVAESLRAVADSLHGVAYIPIRDLVEFDEDDYVDLSHVNSAAAYAFSSHLLKLLDSSGPSVEWARAKQTRE